MPKTLLMIVTLLLLVGMVQAQDEVDPALEEQLVALEAITQTIRDLPQLEPVERVFPTRTETIEYLRTVYERDLPVEDAERAEAFYRALGFFTPDIDLRELYLTLLSSQVAGFYDPDAKTMNVIPMIGETPGDSLSLTEQITYVHEFTHALQDQHFDLAALLPAELNNQPDRALAIRSLVEGDATVSMTFYTQAVAERNPMAALAILSEGLASGTLFLPPGIPPILVRELTFPYEEGAAFVSELYNEGGWAAVDAAYAAPPQTSEQILHPEKYASSEPAIPVELGDAPPTPGADWTQAWDVTLGEFYIREQVDSELAPSRANRAAAGWGGDRFLVFTNGDQVASWLKIVWDTPEDAPEFHDLYAAYAESRFGGEAQAGCWSNAAEVLCLYAESDGSSVVITAPTLEIAAQLHQ
jgi:hypothetical protein